MQNILNAAEKIFFNVLIICLLSFIYFITVPMNEKTILMGIVFTILYFVTNFYVGYRYNLKLLPSLIVGIAGCGIGIFLGIFAICSQIILDMPDFATWIMMPYFIPTMSLVKLTSINITLEYSFYLMAINISLVMIGSISKNIMNKISP